MKCKVENMLGSDSTDITNLRVKEAATRDVGRGIARMDPIIESKMNLISGDVLEIQGTNKKTYVLYWRGFPEDKSTGGM